MSISLNNHEQRIKTLEGSVSNKRPVYKELYRGTQWTNKITFSESLDNFDFVVFVGSNGNGLVRSYGIQFVELLKKISIPEARDTVICDNAMDSSQGIITLNGWTERSNNNMRIIGVYGLKIYYIFRYNIYKILKLISPILKF